MNEGQTGVDLGIPGLTNLVEAGRGGTAVVYRAWQEDLSRHVAVKVIHASADSGVRRRFEREREAMGRLGEHPGIAQVHATGETRTGELYLVMPYYSSGTLADRISEGAPMPWPDASQLIRTIAETLGAAHDEGITHRDIKPANILLSGSGEPRIADFGISLLSSGDGGTSTTPSFTPYYAAPESFEQVAADTTLDTYGLAATFYALLAGRPPFRSLEAPNDVLSVMSRSADSSADGLGAAVPAALANFVTRGMSKDPKRRPADGRRFLMELDVALEEVETGEPGATITAEPQSQLDQDEAPEEARSSTSKWVMLACLLLGIGVVGFALLNGGGDTGSATTTTVEGAPRVIGLDVVDLTDTTARIVYRGDVCSGTKFTIEGLDQGASGYPTEDRCWDSHQLLLGRPAFSPELLEPDTEYTATVVVIDEEGRESAQASVTFRTDAEYSIDTEVRLSGLSMTEIQATVATVFVATDLCAGSRFYLDDELVHADGYPDTEWCWNQHGFTFGRDEALEPNTSYVARVEAYSREGVLTVGERAFTTAAE